MVSMVYLAAIGWTEWIFVLIGVMLLFGAKKIPELARSMGSSINEFKKGMKEGSDSSDGSKPGDREK